MSQRGEFRTQNTGSGAVVLTKGNKFAISHWCLSMDISVVMAEDDGAGTW